MIYIQSDEERKLPHHFDCACAVYGAIDNCNDFRLTSFEEVQNNKFNTLIKTNLFVGTVEFMDEVFSKINKDPKLPKNSNRKSEIISLKTALERSNLGEKLFIKPLKLKLFSGLILDGTIQSSLADVPDTTKVLAYEVIPNIISEWRGYVHMNKLIDCRCYSGDFMVSPDYDFIQQQINECKQDDFPIAYTIDIGILDDNTCIVIEFNDMWAIGNYGMENEIYLRLLRDRYFEIIRS